MVSCCHRHVATECKHAIKLCCSYWIVDPFRSADAYMRGYDCVVLFGVYTQTFQLQLHSLPRQTGLLCSVLIVPYTIRYVGHNQRKQPFGKFFRNSIFCSKLLYIVCRMSSAKRIMYKTCISTQGLPSLDGYYIVNNMQMTFLDTTALSCSCQS